jgi:beta-galactosidase/beta-glucuronidase
VTEELIAVNGDPVWVRGFNWIPLHVLLEEVSREHVHGLVSEAVAT